MMQPDDLALLQDCRAALARPFRARVRVGGGLIPRKLARQIERNLARLAVLDRRGAA